MRTLAAVALGAAWMLLAPATAQACGPGPGPAFLHKVLPGSIPADAIVAEIEFGTEFDLRPNSPHICGLASSA